MKLKIESISISGFKDFDVDQQVNMPQNEVCAIVGYNRDDGGSNASGKTSFATSVPVNLFGPKAIDIASSDLKNNHLKVPARVVGQYEIDGEPLIIDRTIGGKLLFKYKTADWKTGKVDDIQEDIDAILGVTMDQFLNLSYKPQEGGLPFLLMKDADKKEFLGSFFGKEIKKYEQAKEEIDVATKSLSKKIDIDRGSLLQLELMLTSALEQKKYLSNDLIKFSTVEYVGLVDSLTKAKESLIEQIVALNAVIADGAQIKASSRYVEAFELHKQLVNRHNPSCVVLNARILDLQTQRTLLEEQVNKPFTVPIELQKNLELSQTRLEHFDRLEVKLRTAIVARDASHWDKVRLEKDIANIDKESITENCYACGQKKAHIHDDRPYRIKEKQDQIDQNAKAFQDQEEAVKIIQAELLNKSGALEEIKRNELAIFELRTQYNSSNSKRELEAIKQSIADLNISKAFLKREVEASENTLTVIEAAIVSELNSQLSRLRLERNNYESQLSSLEKTKVAAEMKLAEANSSINKTNEALIVGKDLVQFSEKELVVNEATSYILSRSGFLGYIFDSILEDLNAEININLKMIPNVRQYSLNFMPDKIIKTTGALNKSITHEIKRGQDLVNWKPLSGGEKLGLIIAVEEALDSVISKRLGVHIGWKFLDEQFSWIDENSKEAILDFYKMKSHNKTYFIVDHASEFNAALDSRIVIEKNNGLARIIHGQ